MHSGRESYGYKSERPALNSLSPTSLLCLGCTDPKYELTIPPRSIEVEILTAWIVWESFLCTLRKTPKLSPQHAQHTLSFGKHLQLSRISSYLVSISPLANQLSPAISYLQLSRISCHILPLVISSCQHRCQHQEKKHLGTKKRFIQDQPPTPSCLDACRQQRGQQRHTLARIWPYLLINSNPSPLIQGANSTSRKGCTWRNGLQGRGHTRQFWDEIITTCRQARSSWRTSHRGAGLSSC